MSEYIESGYLESGYLEGDASLVDPYYDGATIREVSGAKHFRIDVKKSSSKTKEEVMVAATAEVEARQAQAGENVAVYADVYDARDKTITRIFSSVAAEAGFGYGNIAFGGDVEQVTQEITNATTTLRQEITRVDGKLSTVMKPKLKLVSPFEAVILDTDLEAVNGAYAFSFDSTPIGHGNYHIEIEFEEAGV